MNTIDVTESIRKQINDYLNVNYGMELPFDQTFVFQDKKNYIYMDEENGNCIYIPKTN